MVKMMMIKNGRFQIIQLSMLLFIDERIREKLLILTKG